MAKNLSKTGISNNNTIEATHITQSLDAFMGLDAYDIYLSGSLTVTGSISGTINNSDTASKLRTTIETGSATQFYPYFGSIAPTSIQGTVYSNQAFIDPSKFYYQPSVNRLNVTASQAISASYAPSNTGIGYFDSGAGTFGQRSYQLVSGVKNLASGSASVDFSGIIAGKVFGTDFFVVGLNKASTLPIAVNDACVLVASGFVTPSVFEVREKNFQYSQSIGVTNDPFHYLVLII